MKIFCCMVFVLFFKIILRQCVYIEEVVDCVQIVQFIYCCFNYIIFIFVGNFSLFMQKEIFEQLEFVVNIMRGRVNFDDYIGNDILYFVI